MKPDVSAKGARTIVHRVQTGTPIAKKVARPRGFEPLTFGFGGWCSIGTSPTNAENPRTDAVVAGADRTPSGQRRTLKDTATVSKPGPVFRPSLLDRALRRGGR